MSIKEREEEERLFAAETDRDHYKLGNPAFLAVNQQTIEEVIDDPRYQTLSDEDKHEVWNLNSGIDKDGNELPDDEAITFGDPKASLEKILNKDQLELGEEPPNELSMIADECAAEARECKETPYQRLKRDKCIG